MEKIVIIEDPIKKRKGSLRADKQSVKNKWLYKRFRLKTKRVFNYLKYFILILFFMLLPIFIILLLTGMGL